MLTCKSPRTVMRTAYALACGCLPQHTSRFSRKEFTLPQLFACLVVKDLLKRSYRGAEAVLRDSPHWLADIGMTKAPDHNTLCRAARILMRDRHVSAILDTMAQWAREAELLQLDTRPLAVDSTMFDSHHVSRHYERRCQETRRRMKQRDRKNGRKTSRSRTVSRLPKLAIGVATANHLILSAWTGTGAGADHPHFEPVVSDARKRVPNRRFKVVADAGYDGEPTHELARREMGLLTLIPAQGGRPRKDGGPPGGRWRRAMKRLLATKQSRKKHGYTNRWQVETVNSMIKRNQGSALAGKKAWSRRRDMLLRVITHNVMILQRRVETEQT
jgi:Transposase DDE domain